MNNIGDKTETWSKVRKEVHPRTPSTENQWKRIHEDTLRYVYLRSARMIWDSVEPLEAPTQLLYRHNDIIPSGHLRR